MLTWILEVVLGSRNDLTVFHNSLNPEPALMMNIRLRDCVERKVPLGSIYKSIHAFVIKQRCYSITEFEQNTIVS
jgi:hypothetical protein